MLRVVNTAVREEVSAACILVETRVWRGKLQRIKALRLAMASSFRVKFDPIPGDPEEKFEKCWVQGAHPPHRPPKQLLHCDPGCRRHTHPSHPRTGPLWGGEMGNW